jgi:hippurate hydrolase
MDALPVAEQTGLPFASNVRAKNATGEEVGVMHACGHDIHMTTLLGTAKVLADLRASWRGTLVLLGQPAEEVVQGASAMLGGGLYERFPRPAYLLAFHDWPAVPSGKIGYRAGYIMANSDSVNITVRGVGGHGAAPEKSKDPIVVAAQIVLALQTIVSRETSPFESAVVTVGSIHGGAKRNIIPDDVKLLITVRTYKPDVRQRVLASIDRVAKGIAAAAGIPADREPIIEHVAPEATDAVFNDPPLTERVTKALARGMGVERIVEAEPSMVSEDFGRLGLDRKIPLLMLFLGAGDGTENQAGLHSSRFAPPPESTIRTGVKGMTLAVMELMGR